MIVYGSARFIGAPVARAVGIVGISLGLVALFAIDLRPLAFRLAYVPFARPIILLGFALLAAPLPLLRRAWVGEPIQPPALRLPLALGRLSAAPPNPVVTVSGRDSRCR